MQAQRCAEPASTTATALSLHAGCAASVRSAPPCRGIDALGHWCSLPVSVQSGEVPSVQTSIPNLPTLSLHYGVRRRASLEHIRQHHSILLATPSVQHSPRTTH